ncbi:MAG: hypothetical protein CL395_08545 [Acidiferrobacteraceae bacterium]|nr:hypothetical protein [Acidiferrobacteraceae bacterium]HJP07966.1 type VI secretion protein IcmF/TssM N-terminal domain-containing protein [Arenicellales bacterium]|tara:strand:+ start:3771 stop:7361 length:3591 start_codon:yes stop_codon:yes gene_type:complete
MKVFKWFLIVLLIAAISLGILIVMLGLGYPEQAAIRVTAYFLIAVVAFFVLRRLLNRWRAKRKAKQLLDLEPREKSLLAKLGFSRDASEDRFRQLQKAMRRRVGRSGEYQVPWLIEFECEAGDFRRYLKRHNNNAALEISPDVSSGSAIDIDILDSFLCLSCGPEIVDGGSSNKVWQDLLQSLNRYREQRPFEGVIISAPVGLLMGSEDRIHEMGRSVNDLIQSAIRALRIQVPVFLVVTDLWRLDGFDEFTRLLSEAERGQALGAGFGQEDKHFLNTEDGLQKFSLEFINELGKVIQDKIALNIAEGSQNGISTASLIRLQGQVSSLSAALGRLIESISGSELQRIRPNFRGVYFLSFAPRGDLVDPKKKPASVFYQELIERILPQESGATTTLEFAERLFRGTRKRVLNRIGVAWIIVGLVIAVEGSLDLRSLNLIRSDFLAFAPISNSDYEVNLIRQLDHKRTLIDTMESEVTAYLSPPVPLPWLGVPSDQSTVEKMKGEWADKAKRILTLLDEQHLDSIRAAKTEYRLALDLESERLLTDPALNPQRNSAFSKLGQAIKNTMDRINVVRAIEDKRPLREILEMPNPFGEGSSYALTRDDPEVAGQVFTAFVYTKIWDQYSSDPGSLAERRDYWTASFKNLVSGIDPKLTWLLYLANDEIEKIKPELNSADLWAETPPPLSATVQPVWSDEGVGFITDFFSQIRRTGTTGVWVDDAESEIQKDFFNRRVLIWTEYAETVLLGNSQLDNRQMAQESVIQMASARRNPYRSALRIMAEENQESFFPGERPDWINLALFHRKIELLGGDEEGGGPSKTLTKLGLKMLSKFGAVGKAVSKDAKKGLKTKKKLDKEKGGAARDEQLENAAKEYKEKYLPALELVAFSADSRNASFSTITDRFLSGDDPGAGATALAAGYKSIRTLEMMLGLRDKYTRIYWDLISAPFSVSENYLLEEAACQVDQLWREEVLAGMDNVPESAKFSKMFQEGGLAWTFLDEKLKPFVKTSPGVGLVPRKVGARALPLTAGFFDFLSTGRLGLQSMQDTYTTQLLTRPVTVNSQAALKPVRTTMVLLCENGKKRQKVVNQNFSSQGQIEWSHACSDFRLDIDFGIFELRKVYKGLRGYPRFLEGFEADTLRLTKDDFPAYAPVFKQQKLGHIDLQYQILGKDALIKAARERPTDTPAHIATCWPVEGRDAS